MRELHFGDNLAVLRREVKDESVDLVYLDPPFNSNANYNVLFKESSGSKAAAQAEAFRDTWGWGDAAEAAFSDVMKRGGRSAMMVRAFRGAMGDVPMMAYLAMMAARLIEMRRVMKPTASLYLHCDPTASHYLKIILDALFGADNARNEIIWKRTGAHNSARRWAPVHDSILFYSRSEKYTWNSVYQPYEPGYVESKYRRSDAKGVFQDVSATGAGVRAGASGKEWQGLDPTSKGRHWAISEEAGSHISGFGEMSPQERLDNLEAAGDLYWSANRDTGESLPRIKQRVGSGVPIADCITDIAALNSRAKERLGYPTQKPLSLLERIISASSNAGDLVLDPFCGCGTTVHAAEALGRQWVGIDVTHYAITLIENRLQAAFGKIVIDISGRPADLSSAHELARRDRYQFEWWAAWLVGAQAYEGRKGADRGIDGNIFFANGPFGTGRVIVSVKSGANVGVAMVRDLRGTIERDDAELGLLVTLHEPTEPMRREASAAGFVKTAHGEFPRLQIFSISDWFDGRRPRVPRPITLDELPAPPKKVARDDPQMAFRFLFKGSGPKDLHVDPSVIPIAMGRSVQR